MTRSRSRCSTRSCLSRSTLRKVSVSILSSTAASDRRQPILPLVAKGQKVRVQQVVFGVVSQRLAGWIDHTPAGALEDSLRGRGVPLRRRSQPRIKIGGTFRNETYFERAAHRGNGMRPERGQIVGERATLVAAAADHARRNLRRSLDMDRFREFLPVLSPGAEAKRAEIEAIDRRREHDADLGPVA